MGHVIFTLDTQVCIVPIPAQVPNPPDLTVLFFEVLRVTAHHAKFLHSESEGRFVKLPYLMHFGRHDIIQQRFAHTRCGLVCSVLPLQHEIRIQQAMTERCRNLATRLRVGTLCSMIQLSPPSGWPQQSMDKAMMQDDSVPPGS